MNNAIRNSSIIAAIITICSAPGAAAGKTDLQARYVPASTRGLTATVLGGAAVNNRVAPGANVGGIVGFEFKLRSSSWTLTPELMVTYSRAPGDSEFGTLLTGARVAYYLEPLGRGGLSIWSGFHLGMGLHSDDTKGQNAFRWSAGIDYMVRPHFGIGAFCAAALQSYGTTLLRDGTEGGFIDVSFGLRLKTKIPM